MATYDYKCSKCDTKFEKNVPSADRDKEIVCSICGEKANRLLTFVGTVYAPTAGGMK